MVLYHTTEAKLLPSIMLGGILPRRGKVWLHVKRLTSWAVDHLSAHHGCLPACMVTLAVCVSRHKIFPAGGKPAGRWLTKHSLTPCSILYVIFHESEKVGFLP